MTKRRVFTLRSDEMDTLRDEFKRRGIVGTAHLSHLMILKVVNQHCVNGVEWFASQREDWQELALLSKYQFDTAKTDLVNAGLLYARRGAEMQTSRQILYLTTNQMAPDPYGPNVYRYRRDDDE